MLMREKNKRKNRYVYMYILYVLCIYISSALYTSKLKILQIENGHIYIGMV